MVALLIVIAYEIRRVIVLQSELVRAERQDRQNITEEPGDALSKMQLYFI